MIILIFFWVCSKYLVVKPEGFLRENIESRVTVVFVLYVFFFLSVSESSHQVEIG